MELLTLLNPQSAVFWFVAGAALLILEVVLPGFLALGFGIGAWMLAAIIFLFVPDATLSVPTALMLWALLSAATWVILRVIFKNRFSGSDGSDGDINEY